MTLSGTILVSGAAGFLASHVCEALTRRGVRVVGLDNFDPFYPRADKERNLREARAAGGFEVVECDLCDEHAVRALVDRVRPDGVIHLAAKAGVRPSITDPVGFVRANVLGTQVLLDAARAGGCGRVVMASSSSVYGNAKVVPFSEDAVVDSPISPYAASKRACELIAFTHHALTKMPIACLRFFTVYGPRQRPDLAVSLFLRKVAAGDPIEMFGDGTTSRDYTYCDDIVAGVLAAYERIDAHGQRVWNLGNSSPVSLADMIATIGRVVGREPKVVRKPMQQGDVDRTYADISRASAELNYRPGVAFEEGVRRQWAWAQS
ncbi:MAG: NAD-dependent epimerase/dehydratase family protein [Phycisphaerales bacterium]